MSNRVAVFGCKGYLGTQLVEYLRRSGRVVDGFDLPDCDILNPDFWTAFKPEDYDGILFFAGLTGTEKSFDAADCFTAVNIQGLLNLLKVLAPMGRRAPHVVFPSSRLVYKGSDLPLCEDSDKEAKTVYAASKLAGEALLQAYAARYGLRYAVVRICVPYGNIIFHDYSYGTIGFFLKQAKSGTITLYGGGAVRRTFTHVLDICEVVSRLLVNATCGTFNVGGSVLSLHETATLIAEALSSTVSVSPWPEVALKLESGSTYFDATRLSQAIGFADYHSFKEWVDKTLKPVLKSKG